MDKKPEIMRRLGDQFAARKEAANWPHPTTGTTYGRLVENTGLQRRIQKTIQNAITRVCAGEKNVTANIGVRRSDSAPLIREVEMYAKECLESHHAEKRITVNIMHEKGNPEQRPGTNYLSFTDFQGIRDRAQITKDVAREDQMRLRKKDAGLFMVQAAQDQLKKEGWERVLFLTRDTLATFLWEAYGIRVA